MKRRRLYASGLQLAKRVVMTSPNPDGGCRGRKRGQDHRDRGWHQRYGQALMRAQCAGILHQISAGATLYVTLSRAAITESSCTLRGCDSGRGIYRVVDGSVDPNGGWKRNCNLRAHGIDADRKCSCKGMRCEILNKAFFQYNATKTFRLRNIRTTMYGKIGTYTGASKWITGEILPGTFVQRQRHRFRGIMVESTIPADDPLLTCRIEGGRASCPDSSVILLADTAAITVTTAKQVPTILRLRCGDPEKQVHRDSTRCRVLVWKSNAVR